MQKYSSGHRPGKKNLMDYFNRSFIEGRVNSTISTVKRHHWRSNSYVDALKQGRNKDQKENASKDRILLEELKRTKRKDYKSNELEAVYRIWI